MTDDHDNAETTDHNPVAWMTQGQRERLRQDLLFERELKMRLPALRKFHSDNMQPDRRDAYRAKVIEKQRENLRFMKAQGDFDATGVEDAMAIEIGRWLVADDPARAARVAPTAHFWNEAVRGALAELYDQDKSPPADLKELGLAFLKGTAQPTKPRGRGANIGIRIAIRLLVDRLALFGWPITRNEASEHRDTACDLVAEALQAEGLSPTTYDGVRKIYYEGQFSYAVQFFEKLRKDGALGENFEPPAEWGEN